MSWYSFNHAVVRSATLHSIILLSALLIGLGVQGAGVSNLHYISSTVERFGAVDPTLNAQLAQGFTTGPVSSGNDRHLLESILVPLYQMNSGQFLGAPASPDLITFGLYSPAVNASHNPGIKIVDLLMTTPEVGFHTTAPAELFELTPAVPTWLAPNSTYWIVASSSGSYPQAYAWLSTTFPGEIGDAGWSINNGVRRRFNLGAWGDGLSYPILQINASPVPESGFLSGGFCGLLLLSHFAKKVLDRRL